MYVDLVTYRVTLEKVRQNTYDDSSREKINRLLIVRTLLISFS